MKLHVEAEAYMTKRRQLTGQAMVARTERVWAWLLAASLVGGLLVSAAALSGAVTGIPISPELQELQELNETADSSAPGVYTYPYIYIANADGSVITPLTQGRSPAWSPDGRQIAFQRRGMIHVHVIDDGGEYTLIEGDEPAWSPDGTRLAFGNRDGIAALDLDDLTVTVLLRHDFLVGLPPHLGVGSYAPWDMGVGKPSWSPDGEQIAFHHRGDGYILPGQIYVMNADGTSPRRLTMPDATRRYAEFDPAWSPDGSRIALWSYGYGLASVSAQTGASVVVHARAGYSATPSWSADGSKIAFTLGMLASPAVWIVDSSGGSAPRMLIPQAYKPAWSPDGTSIAFVRDITTEFIFGEFPNVLLPASIYDRESPHTLPAGALSRYVLYENGTFELLYLFADGDFAAYGGTFSRADSEIALDFDDDPQWQATGTFSDTDDLLLIEYNQEMALNDFEDGIYEYANPTTQGAEGPVKDPDEPSLPEPPPVPEPPSPIRFLSTDQDYSGFLFDEDPGRF